MGLDRHIEIAPALRHAAALDVPLFAGSGGLTLGRGAGRSTFITMIVGVDCARDNRGRSRGLHHGADNLRQGGRKRRRGGNII